MAAAAQLNSLGHTVTVYERSEAIGGLMRLGVPDFKLEKWVIDRRVEVLQQEGVRFRCDTEVSRDVGIDTVRDQHDAVVLTNVSDLTRSGDPIASSCATMPPIDMPTT